MIIEVDRNFLVMIMNDYQNFTYEFYRREQNGERQFIGSLIEKRTNRERITCASIMNWVKRLYYMDVFENRVFFVRIEF